MQYPVTLARRDYINKICDITNNSGLPAFVVADILEKVLSQVRQQEEAEIKRDEAVWHKACSEVNDDGRQEDKPVSDEKCI